MLTLWFIELVDMIGISKANVDSLDMALRLPNVNYLQFRYWNQTY